MSDEWRLRGRTAYLSKLDDETWMRPTEVCIAACLHRFLSIGGHSRRSWRSLKLSETRHSVFLETVNCEYPSWYSTEKSS